MIACTAILALLSAAVLDSSNVFYYMCFSNPMAWLFGLLTILADFIFMYAKFKKLARGEISDAESAKKSVKAE